MCLVSDCLLACQQTSTAQCYTMNSTAVSITSHEAFDLSQCCSCIAISKRWSFDGRVSLSSVSSWCTHHLRRCCPRFRGCGTLPSRAPARRGISSPSRGSLKSSRYPWTPLALPVPNAELDLRPSSSRAQIPFGYKIIYENKDLYVRLKEHEHTQKGSLFEGAVVAAEGTRCIAGT